MSKFFEIYKIMLRDFVNSLLAIYSLKRKTKSECNKTPMTKHVALSIHALCFVHFFGT